MKQNKIDVVGGIEFATFIGSVQVSLPAGSYLTGCFLHGHGNGCSVADAMEWIGRHGVFGSEYYFYQSIFWIVAGFLVGALVRPSGESEEPRLSRFLEVALWIIIMLLVSVFALIALGSF